MNKSIIKLLTLVCAVLVSVSCLSNYEEYNLNPSEATDEQMNADDTKTMSAMQGMQNNIIPYQVHLYQFIEVLMGSTYGGYFADSKPWDNSYACYNPSQVWLEKPMETIVNIYKNQKLLKAVTSDPIMLAICDVIRISAIVRLSDYYGPIPYSKIGEDGQITTEYDSQKAVYTTMFSELDAAIATLGDNRTAQFSPRADLIYRGAVEKWLRYANTLKLRMALRVVYADETLSRTKAEEVLAHPAGTLSSNSENAFLPVALNPLTTIFNEWGDSRVSADITTYMNGYNDPRRAQYFTQSTFTSASNGYYGMRIGYVASSQAQAKQYANINTTKVTEKGLLLMNAAEAAFLKAECALRWNIGSGSAQALYEEGIRLSFEQWGAGSASSYLSNNTRTPASYVDPLGQHSNTEPVSTVRIAWDNNADTETNLERIITQKWIANFPLGNEAWAEYRRTGYPRLMKAPENKSGGIVSDTEHARRLPYPQKEYQQNGENMTKAVQALGGDDNMATHVWWDCKNN